MSSLVSYVSSDRQRASNSLYPKSAPKKVRVYVEANTDVSFWHGILSRYEKSAQIKLDVSPYSNSSSATGKKELEKIFDQTGDYLIICLDSDYDYLFPDHTDTAKAINQNLYVFQTYAYSMENLKCYADSLKDICVQATQNTSELIDFTSLLEQYSKIIYWLFIWNLYFYSLQDDGKFPVNELKKIIRIAKEPNINEYDKVLEELENSVNTKLQELGNQFPGYKNPLMTLAEQLNSLGLNDTNTYLFINGHALYETVLMFLNPVDKALKDEKRQEIRNRTQVNNSDEEKNYKNSTQNVRNILSNNDKFKECFLFRKIENDIESYLNNFIANNF